MSFRYTRYTVFRQASSSLCEMGLFTAAYQLRDAGVLPEAEQQDLLRHLHWFQRHMRTAALDDLSHLDQQAVCWYKSAHSNQGSVDDQKARAEARNQTEALSATMKRHGFTVRIEQTNRVGIIIYEDRVQVAAIPARNCIIGLYLRAMLWRQRNIPQFD